MSKCIDTKPIQGCFTPTSWVDPIWIVIHVTYERWKAVWQTFTLPWDNESPIDITSYLWWWSVSVWACPVKQEYYNEVYRLNWDLTWVVVATPEIPVHSWNSSIIPLLPWNTVTISWERRALKWRYLRETNQDWELDINSRTYRAWFGEIYIEQWHAEWTTDEDSVFNYEKTFTAKPWTYVEIHVQREI